MPMEPLQSPPLPAAARLHFTESESTLSVQFEEGCTARVRGPHQPRSSVGKQGITR
jgi:hypothetical protein